MTERFDFTIEQGSTFSNRIRYSQPQLEVKAITAITRSGQAVITSTHGLAGDWIVWVVGVTGMTQINHRPDDLDRTDKAYQAYYVSSTSLRLDVDTSRFRAYGAGGEVLYYPPVNLTGCTARMQLRESVDDDDVILSLTTENGGITLGGAVGTIDLLITATATAALDFSTAVYDLEVVDGSGVVVRLLNGAISLSKEVTR